MLGTADATPLQFWIAVAPGRYLQLDDVVVTHRELPDREPVTIAGVVTQVRARHEGAQFDSDVFAIADGTLPAQVQEAAEITTTRVDPEVYVPPAPGRRGAPGRAATRGPRALHFDRMERRVPIGTGRDGVPLYLNADFLDGSRGAHVSISGISGVATKTSFATFLLYSVFRSGVLGGPDAANTKALDLQRQGRGPALPRPPERPARRRHRRRVRHARPARRRRSPTSASTPRRAPATPSGTPDVSSRLTGVDSFYWTLAEFCADRLLPYVFADADDERQQYTMVVHSVTAHLARRRPAGRRRRHASTAPAQLLRATWSTSSSTELTDEDARAAWAGSAVGLGTVNAFSRRLIGSKKDLARLIRGDLRRPAARTASTPPRAPRSPSSTCTTCPTGRSASWSA